MENKGLEFWIKVIGMWHFTGPFVGFYRDTHLYLEEVCVCVCVYVCLFNSHDVVEI